MKQSPNNLVQKNSGSVQSQLGHRLILVVDNIPHAARTTSQLFKSMGYSTEVAYSTSAALKMLASGEVFPDLVFVEMRSYDESGIQFPKAVCSLPLWSHLPIMARTIASDKENILRAIRNGYCDLILRPTETDILKEKIDKVFFNSPKIDDATFALPVSAHARMSVDLEISSINEFGILATSAIPLKSNSVIRLSSDFLDQFELRENFFRVVGCEEFTSGKTTKYKVGLTFVGLNAKSSTLIRQYLVRNSSRVLKVS